ncbi:MAG TPA: asparagine synthase (glutamine-hydrolyzing) [Candidatus Acidoferrum sp.]|nr:asparagine synthase (glutamine-hydrolyzing) [Candidatus Acidoferrum sp.]
MCGIVGAVGSPDQVQEESLLQGLAALEHRGPDDSGWQVIRESGPQPSLIFLGNRRLAILDLSPAGHQPMQDRETGNWIVYNGEIYNFREVRSELGSCGVAFHSHSDTEVILKAYSKWGTQCLDRFRGMFAFAIWDARTRVLFLARDRFGEKPLYYFHRDGLFLFSSEVRSLLQTGLIARQIDEVGLMQFLRYGSVSNPDTLIKGIHSLPPAHFALLREGELTLRKYWDLNSAERDLAAPGEVRHIGPETIAELRTQLEDAILLRTVSDVPVGVFLSGGIDSSALVALLSSRHSSLSTFSVVFNESDYSEAEYSRSISTRFGTDHHEIEISSREVMMSLPHIVGAMDQPTVDGVNTYIISRETRRMGLKVALSGLGADEIFAGYETFTAVPRMERVAWYASTVNPALRRKLAAWTSLATLKRGPRMEKMAALIAGDRGIPHPYALARTLFMPRLLRQLSLAGDGRSAESAMRPLADIAKSAARFDPFNRNSYFELRHYMTNTLLRDSDFMSMAHGLELRVPFIDHKLVEFLFRIPGALKLKSGAPKWLLTEALQGALPQQAVQRPKRGFTFPFDLWLKKEMRHDIEDSLLDSTASLIDGVDRKFVVKVWKDFLAGRTTWSRPWSLYVLKQWVDKFVESRPTSSIADLSEEPRPPVMAQN